MKTEKITFNTIVNAPEDLMIEESEGEENE